MITSGLRWLMVTVVVVITPLATSHAQNYPEKKLLRIVSPFPAGSATDVLSRVVGKSFTDITGQTAIVEDRPGANGVFAADYVAKSPADGYTLLMGTQTTNAANQWIMKKIPYDPVKDFTPVTGIAKGWSFLVVNSSSPIKSVQELVTKAKQAPDTLTYGGGGSTSRICVEHFAQMADIKPRYIGYKGNPEAVQNLVSGLLDFMITDITTALPQIEGGKLRALAFTGDKRSPRMPDVPTLDEAGVKGFECSYWQAVYVPAKTPDDVVEKLRGLLHAAIEREDVKKYLKTNGLVSFPTTSQELARHQKQQTELWGEVIRKAGIVPQ